MEALGAEVLLLRADVTNEEQMLAAIARTVEQFGRIDGVIYGAAAEINADKDIREMTPADCKRQFQTKVTGLMVLEKVLEGTDHDFCLILSSLSTVLGGMTYRGLRRREFLHGYIRAEAQSDASRNMDDCQLGRVGC